MLQDLADTIRQLVADIRDHPLETALTITVVTVAALVVALFAPSINSGIRAIGVGLTRLLLSGAARARKAAAWLAGLPIAAFVADLSRFAVTAITTVSEAITSAIETLGRWMGAAWAALAGPTWTGWRVIGGVFYTTAFILYLWADAGLLLATVEHLTQTRVAWVPEFMRELGLQLVVTSVVSAAVLGSVISDVAGVTHLGPWSTISRNWRWAVGSVAALLFVVLVAAGLMITAYRADEILRQAWLDAETRTRFAALGQTLPVGVMLAATGIVGWGAIAMIWTLYLAVLGLASLGLRLLRLVLAILERIFGEAGGAVLTRLITLALGLVRIVLALVATAFDLLRLATGAVVQFAHAVVGVLARPGTVVWAWFAGLTGKRTGFAPIVVSDTTAPKDEEVADDLDKAA